MARKLSKLKALVLASSIGAGAAGMSGCAGQGVKDYLDNPFEFTAKSIRYMTGGDMNEEKNKETNENNLWAGTAVVRRYIYPDGTIIFLVDPNRIRSPLTDEYTDQFVDSSKYKRKIQTQGVIKYIPLE